MPGTGRASFSKPRGINFSSAQDVSSIVLARSLCRVASFLQNLYPYGKLQKYWDAWEHGMDGGPFWKEEIDIHGLFKIVESPRNLLWAMPGDFSVLIGIAPNDNSWYLRFYIDWDEDGFELVGRFDITIPAELAKRF